MVERKDMDRILAAERFMSRLQADLIDIFIESGLTLEELAARLEISVEACFHRLQDREGITLRDIGEIAGALLGSMPEIRMRDLREIRARAQTERSHG